MFNPYMNQMPLQGYSPEEMTQLGLNPETQSMLTAPDPGLGAQFGPAATPTPALQLPETGYQAPSEISPQAVAPAEQPSAALTSEQPEAPGGDSNMMGKMLAAQAVGRGLGQLVAPTPSPFDYYAKWRSSLTR